MALSAVPGGGEGGGGAPPSPRIGRAGDVRVPSAVHGNAIAQVDLTATQVARVAQHHGINDQGFTYIIGTYLKGNMLLAPQDVSTVDGLFHTIDFLVHDGGALDQVAAGEVQNEIAL